MRLFTLAGRLRCSHGGPVRLKASQSLVFIAGSPVLVEPDPENRPITCPIPPAVGTKAPDFVLVNSALSNVTLADYAGKRKLLNIVPSLDTPVCAISTKRFNDAAREHLLRAVEIWNGADPDFKPAGDPRLALADLQATH